MIQIWHRKDQKLRMDHLFSVGKQGVRNRNMIRRKTLTGGMERAPKGSNASPLCAAAEAAAVADEENGSPAKGSDVNPDDEAKF